MTWYGADSKLLVDSKLQNTTDCGAAGSKYLVATGAIVFTQYATSAKQALLLVKERLQAAYDSEPNRYDQERISRALVQAFADGSLNIIVMDGERTRLICGECAGVFEQPVTRRLADSLRHLIPDAVEMKRRAACRNEVGS